MRVAVSRSGDPAIAGNGMDRRANSAEPFEAKAATDSGPRREDHTRRPFRSRHACSRGSPPVVVVVATFDERSRSPIVPMIPNRPLNAPVSADVAGLAAPLLHCSSPVRRLTPKSLPLIVWTGTTRSPDWYPKLANPGYETAASRRVQSRFPVVASNATSLRSPDRDLARSVLRQRCSSATTTPPPMYETLRFVRAVAHVEAPKACS